MHTLMNVLMHTLLLVFVYSPVANHFSASEGDNNLTRNAISAVAIQLVLACIDKLYYARRNFFWPPASRDSG